MIAGLFYSNHMNYGGKQKPILIIELEANTRQLKHEFFS